MTHIITSLCLRDGGCVDVCPVECIVPGKPQSEWPWFYIDPEVCIDCGACIPECPFESIFTEDEVPDAYEATGGEYVSLAVGTAGHDTVWEGEDHQGREVKLEATRVLEAGEVLDLTEDNQPNYDFFEDDGPGYWDGWEDFVNP